MIRRDARIAPPPQPAALARDYERELLARVRETRRILDAELAKVVPLTGLQAAPRRDSPEDDAAKMIGATRTARGIVATEMEPGRVTLRERALRIVAWSTRTTHDLIRRAIAQAEGERGPTVIRIPTSTVAPEDLITAWVRENVDLIKSIDARYFDDVEAQIVEAWRAGTNTQDLTRRLAERYGVSQSRARLIARDQVGKLNGQVNRRRQMEAGVESYEWSDSGDQRVRPVHVQRNGRVFRWRQHPSEVDGNPDGHPGEPIQCRCSAIPIID